MNFKLINCISFRKKICFFTLKWNWHLKSLNHSFSSGIVCPISRVINSKALFRSAHGHVNKNRKKSPGRAAYWSGETIISWYTQPNGTFFPCSWSNRQFNPRAPSSTLAAALWRPGSDQWITRLWMPSPAHYFKLFFHTNQPPGCGAQRRLSERRESVPLPWCVCEHFALLVFTKKDKKRTLEDPLPNGERARASICLSRTHNSPDSLLYLFEYNLLSKTGGLMILSERLYQQLTKLLNWKWKYNSRVNFCMSWCGFLHYLQ